MLEAADTANVKVDVSHESVDRPNIILAIVNKSCWFANVILENIGISMLVDTGSAVTLVSKRIFEKLDTGSNKLSEVACTLTTADGDRMKILGQTQLALQVGDKTFCQNVIIADLGDIQGILGMDFLAANAATIDTGRGSMKIGHFEAVLTGQSKRDICARVAISETVSIPARSEVYVRGKLKTPTGLAFDGILEPEIGFNGEKHVLIPKSVVRSEDSEITFSVLNPTPDNVILKQNMEVASVQTVDEIYDDKVKPEVTAISADTKLPEHLMALINDISSQLTEDEKFRVHGLISQYSDIFVGPDNVLGQTDLVEHKIDVRDAKPIKMQPRRLPISQREIADKEIESMLQAELIEPSTSPWAAPIVLVKKKDNTTRFCVDYRKINSVTVLDSYPLPRIDESLERLSGANFYCTLDLAQGFYQVKMSDEHKPLTAFTTHRGLFQFRVMPFGLANSPKTFERLMELVLSGLQFDRCLVYLDDVVVFGKDFTETYRNLASVFDRFKGANLKLKPRKCKLFQNEVRYLGHVVSAAGIKCDPEKLDSIKSWPTPRSVSDVRSFLGIASYYRKFILDFSTIAYPMTQLTRKDKRFEWTDCCEDAFLKLKDALTSAPVLAYPKPNGQYILDTDASNFGVGGVLSQVQDGVEKVIAYGSKTLSRSQRGYCTTYRELLAVVIFVKQFKHYLYGREFLLRTDHASLVWLTNFKEPEGMVARWLAMLGTYQFQVQHRRGSQHGNADALSRRPRKRCQRDECQQCGNGFDCDRGVNAITRQRRNNTPEEDTSGSATSDIGSASASTTSDTGNMDDNATSNTGSHSRNARSNTGSVQSVEQTSSNWTDQLTDDDVRTEQERDDAIKQIIDLKKIHTEKPDIRSPIREFNLLLAQWKVLEVRNGILYRKYVIDDRETWTQLVVPLSLRKQFMHQLHNVRTAAHLGRDKTLTKMKSRFYWPGMTDDVSRWCRSCLPCQRRKPGPGLGKSPLHHVTVYGPMEVIAIDIMGPLPVTDNGNQYIMVVADYFSKWTEAYAIKDHTAQTVADKLVTEFICRFGTPTRIHTDQGREFTSELFRTVCKLLEIKKSKTTPYRPQSDGMVERFNRTLQQMLALFVSANKNDWDDHLPYLTMAYRSSVQESTKCTPNLLMLGREISLPLDVMAAPISFPEERECPSEYVEWVREATRNAFNIAHENLQASFLRQKKYYDTKLKEREYESGDIVLRWYPPEAMQKFGLGWAGPYEIVRAVDDIKYEIKRCEDGKSLIVHVDHLKPLIMPDNQSDSENEDSDSESPVSDTDIVQTDFEEHNVQHPCTPARYTRGGRRIKPAEKFSP